MENWSCESWCSGGCDGVCGRRERGLRSGHFFVIWVGRVRVVGQCVGGTAGGLRKGLFAFDLVMAEFVLELFLVVGEGGDVRELLVPFWVVGRVKS